ncbi:L-type lectin-domain containing receptor kinase IX.1-like [Corylus avellana]|uniref:L-type lectin-domain containing receptor kinase IX.1-like n=1 Tax=Corylus avellana TaxID=13451 RepID=UPI001E1F3F46|nr:L-type lectin-domain containing receptor kinase IX.1-like [Corylus avellana]
MDYQQSLYNSFLYLLIFFSCFCFSFTSSTINFSFPNFPTNDNSTNITLVPTAKKAEVDGLLSILLTDNQVAANVFNATGRAYYNQPIPLWDPITKVTTSFTTSFEFVIRNVSSNVRSGGIAFFIASEDSLDAPENSFGGWLGLFNESTNGNSSNRMVAVEFDTYQDEWDPDDNHVGINVNSIVSKTNRTWDSPLTSGDIYVATVSYDGTTKDLNVLLQDPDVPRLANYFFYLTYNVNLSSFLSEKVIVGFSASTGEAVPFQVLRSWNFSSTLDLSETPTVTPTPTATPTAGNSKIGLVIGLIIGVLVLLVAGISFIFWVLLRNRRRKDAVEEDEDEDEEAGILEPMDEVLIQGTGPKRFAYKELVVATDNFSDEGKLGQGGFGGVYRGFLAEQNMEIAVKKVSSSSNQGKKEYVSEVNAISRLRHRNLVQLVGWSQRRNSFLLVYEFMPNGSLDYHLFRKKSHLSWPVRYKIVQGLASGLLYLHEEWEQCVVHRDIKSSNVMLDSNFQAKLGDFGLARLVDHGLGSQTTALAGTMGYMAPECFITSKASKESDVFSFGVVVLEIACGRRVVEHKEEESKISLVNWVWELYGKGRLLDAADDTLNGEYDKEEMKCLMSVGLWCAHPDHTSRPSIRQAIQVLNFEAPLPSLPSHMPVPMYYAPGETTSTQGSFTFTGDVTNK